MADTLSRVELIEKEFGMEVLAFGKQEYPTNFPLTYAQIQEEQENFPVYYKNWKIKILNIKRKI